MVEKSGMPDGTHTSDDLASNPSANAEINTAVITRAGEWSVIGETVPGASHVRAGIPNQDAILLLRESSIGLPLILSISDGHGSNKCFRSDRGSHFAVTIGAGLLRGFLSDKRSANNAYKIEREANQMLPVQFARRWKEAVADDLELQPLSKEELDRLEAKDDAHARQMVEAHPLLAYGATTLTVALTLSYVIYLQLGDGEIVNFSETGEIFKPLAEDERLIANETTSLCSETAAQDFRFAFLPLGDSPPAIILMTTDGYANSFTDDAGFLKVGNDILGMIRTDGFDVVNRSVKGWLEEATRMGSGDDCTLCIICNMSALENSTHREPSVRERDAHSDAPSLEAPPETAAGSEAEPAPDRIS